MDSTHSFLVESLRLLCEREGGIRAVAEAIGSSRPVIWQILHGVKNSSGEVRAIGSRLQKRLDERFPGWYTLALERDAEDLPASVAVPSLEDASQLSVAQKNPHVVTHVRAEWVRERGYKAGDLVFVRTSGRGMEPTLYNGDYVMINLADKTPVDDAVFVVKTSGAYVVRRFIRQGNAWKLHRDNPDQHRYPAAMLEEGDEIIGRVVMRVSEVI